ncbi:IS110 family RNA-guided transposase [Vallitalea guaymasensis]|uniref:IS110 family transposase n=1 Tax=Vallitalea guaymasensis TaxID=1185412 RepID=A0A8J8M7T6_9FIRM|nr:IS110 family transposase [Vallitalea guaymasensis]QUH27536.1 IS110 family transposase [Vallitalea guaymasensis]QUH27693.1 IS110 family transposase [Vallitalea guaymasensis]QUH27957.1 IS110 family transposase [Vallitalea guaymasensis]QUH28303.1 IS110 family transposase [Vallitalea guaymasensis]QUH29243.1 IS110 family transposase [Vallitalea guaymasensis]
MLFIGIDVASKKHDVIIISEYGEILSESFTIENSSAGFKKLHTEISSHTELFDNVHIGLEETGIYSSNIRDFLHSAGFNVYMINPVLTHHSRMAYSLRNTKTDKLDCLAICRYIMHNFTHLKPYISTLYTTSELKSLSRLRLDKLHTLAKAKMEFTRLLQITFPEFIKHFKQHSQWAMNLFSSYPAPAKIARMHLDTLVSIIKIKGDRVSAAQLIKNLAKKTIGDTSITNSLLIESIIDDINHYNKQIAIIDKHLDALMADFDFITTIPGVGNVIGASIIGEIGDISRFNSPSQLLAFAGLDPSIYESGEFKGKRCRISKRGSKYLRTSIFTATRVACVGKGKNNQFRQKYHKKKLQGKHHNSALCNVSKNMINTIFAMLNSKEDFIYIT